MPSTEQTAHAGFFSLMLYKTAFQTRINITFQSYLRIYSWVDSVSPAKRIICSRDHKHPILDQPTKATSQRSGEKSIYIYIYGRENRSAYYFEVLAPPYPLCLGINPHWTTQATRCQRDSFAWRRHPNSLDQNQEQWPCSLTPTSSLGPQVSTALMTMKCKER